jgi:UDP-N-acetylmuramoyl-L-alanyl-D-glutamate--2,6-diaminopimelate ligase
MTLGELLARLPNVDPPLAQLPGAALGTLVAGVAYDSRQVVPGAVFVALRGQKADGTAFVQEAVSRGAGAIVADTPPPAGTDALWVRVPDARHAMAMLAAALYGHPSEQMQVVAITGTNGKTTTSYLIAGIFEAAGIRCGRLGTVGYRIGHEERSASRTTPEAPDVQRLLREMLDEGCGACAMEVSSHALVLKRVDALRFAAGVFTNLTRDHLDFHPDMESYFRAKRSLFERLGPDAVAAVNLDDARGEAIVAASPRAVTYAVERQADVMPVGLAHSLSGLAFDAQTPLGVVRIRSGLVGHFNVYNILAAVATGVGLELPASAIEQGIASVDNVPGRFQVVSAPGDDVTVVVDYAHTDDALKNLLETARPLARRRLVTVFGCGGDRDRTKRPLMGAVAARLSDVVVITSDNPRSEDPERIIEEVKRGIEPDRPTPKSDPTPRSRTRPVCFTIPDRRAAIERAIRDAQSGDLVVIAGKGHEKYQEIGSRVTRFDDVEVAREALSRRRTQSAV